MARSSSSALHVVTSVLLAAALMSSAAARDAPKAADIVANQDFQAALGKAWGESFVGNNLYQVRGGWVYADSNNPDQLFVQLASPQGSAQPTLIPQSDDPHSKIFLLAAQSVDLQLDNPEKEGVPAEEGRDNKVVADFHTHPYPATSSKTQRPFSEEISRAYERGVPGILVSCSGVFYYGPHSRASLDGPAGYPQTSPSDEKYNGQKEERFGDNTFDSQGRCKP